MGAERSVAIASGSLEVSVQSYSGRKLMQGDLKMHGDDKQNCVSTQQLNLNETSEENLGISGSSGNLFSPLLLVS